MPQLIVNPNNYNITNIDENTIEIFYSCNKTLTDVKLSMNNGLSYKNNINFTSNSATFDITSIDNGNYNCFLKGYYEDNTVETVPVTSVSLNKTSHTFTDFTTLQLTATVYPTNATNKNVTWSSNKTEVATVSSSGLVTAKSNGNATITVTTQDGSKTATCSIVVNKVIEEIPPTQASIVANQSSYTVTQGKDLSISVTMSGLPDYPVFELRKNGEYLCSAYKNNDTTIVAYTSSLSEDTYSNVTIVAKEYRTDKYVDIAISNPITITITGSGSSGGGSGSGGGSSPSSLTTDKTSYTINPTEMLEISYTTSVSIPSSCVWELRQSGSYLCSAYKDTSSGKVVCYTGSLSTGTYNNITLVAKEYQSNGYVDIATSNVFSITVGSSSSGGSGSGSGGSGSPSTVNFLDYMYPMPQPHEAIPNGAPHDWKYQSRWENQTKPQGWRAFGGWAQVYRVEGTPFSQNTGVELKDYCVYGWKNGQWHLVSKVPAPSGSFYAEDFQDDAHTTFAGKMLYYGTSVAIRLTEDMTISTSTGTKNVCYHPFTTQLDYDADFEYIFTCVSMRKIKWDEHGVDDRDSARYCASCGGDWWREKGLSWAPDWSNNKGIAQPKITEVTNNWKVFAMTTVPQGWSHGFPL